MWRRSPRFALGCVVAMVLVGCTGPGAEALPVEVPADAAPLWVMVQLTQDDTVVLEQAGMARVGQPVTLAATSRSDEPGLSVSLWVQHYAARMDAFSVRVTVRQRDNILFAPVMVAPPGQPTRFEGSVDEQAIRLVVTVDLAERALRNDLPPAPGTS